MRVTGVQTCALPISELEADLESLATSEPAGPGPDAIPEDVREALPESVLEQLDD